MIDTIRMKNDLLFKANHVCNALWCKAVHGLDGTKGWDDEIINEKDMYAKCMCNDCIYGDEPEDCDYSALLDDAANVMSKLINENMALQKRVKELRGDEK